MEQIFVGEKAFIYGRGVGVSCPFCFMFGDCDTYVLLGGEFGDYNAVDLAKVVLIYIVVATCDVVRVGAFWDMEGICIKSCE